jgi:hypothetical protein
MPRGAVADTGTLALIMAHVSDGEMPHAVAAQRGGEAGPSWWKKEAAGDGGERLEVAAVGQGPGQISDLLDAYPHKPRKSFQPVARKIKPVT